MRKVLAIDSGPVKAGELIGSRLKEIANRAMAAVDPETAAERAREWRDFQLRQAEARRQAWLTSGSRIPPAILETIQRIDRKRLVTSSTNQAVVDGKRLVMIAGPPGTGKTVAACWALAERHRRRDQLVIDDQPDIGAGGLFVTAWDFCQIPAREQRDCSEARCVALVLDDLGREREQDTTNVEELLLRRWDAGRLTICTTNLGPEDIGQRYDARLMSRIQAEGAALVVPRETIR
ncbi:MAG: hypothetical protein MUC88_00300 [Planctomycetes bacterium]|jgi:DNA replication protein DnaC|nr:hypothetical protein [Planctomycetota bacterium]